MMGEQRIASSHWLLKLPCLLLAIALLSAPLLGLRSQWRWLEAGEKAWLMCLAALLWLMAGLLFKFALRTGLFMSEQGFRIQRLFRSESMRWDEVASIRPGKNWGDGQWLLLYQGVWGDFTSEGGESQQRLFMPKRTLFVSSSYSANGLRVFAGELLRRLAPATLGNDVASHRWLMEQASGSGSLWTRLI